MRFDVLNIPKGKRMVDQYPTLTDYDILGDPSRDTLLRLAVLLVDENSPVARNNDWNVRIRKAFDLLKVKDPALEKELATLRNRSFNEVITQYFMMTHNYRYTSWLSKMLNYHMMASRLRAPINPKKEIEDYKNRLEITRMLDQLRQSVEKDEAFLFKDEILKDTIIQENIRVVNWPEMMAEENTVI
jgi:hypothetical protein